MKKGVAIAIETVIYIILAVLVLTVLLMFFTGQYGPTQQQIDMQNKRTIVCGDISTIDQKCESIDSIQGEKLLSACKDICYNGISYKECAKICCLPCKK